MKNMALKEETSAFFILLQWFVLDCMHIKEPQTSQIIVWVVEAEVAL